MTSIYKDLHQFSSYVAPIDITFHQYLLLADESVLVHTGSIQQAEALLPQLKDVLASRVYFYFTL
jgi:hypothetical protein